MDHLFNTVTCVHMDTQPPLHTHIPSRAPSTLHLPALLHLLFFPIAPTTYLYTLFYLFHLLCLPKKNVGPMRAGIFFLINLFIYLFLAVLGPCCCTPAFSSCGERGLLFRCGAWASHCGGFSCCRARALSAWASVVVACGLSSCGSRALERRLSSCGTWA